MLLWVRTAPLGLPVVPEVYMISAGLSFGMSTGCGSSPGSGDQVVVAGDVVIGAATCDDDSLQRRIDVAHRGGHLGQHGFGDHHAGLAVADQEGDLGRGHPEVDRHGDGAEFVGRKERLDELGAVEHQDQHAVAEADPAPAQRARQCRHPPVELSPGRRVTEEPQRRGVGLHQCVPGELVGPVLPARQIRLLGW